MSNDSCGAELDEDARLLCRVVANDESALLELHRKYGGLVSTICLRVCGDPNEAQTAVTDVFWEFWRNAGKFDPTRGTLRTYLMMLARSRAIDRRRAALARTRRETQVEGTIELSGDEQLDPMLNASRVEQQGIIAQALDRLDANQKNLVVMAFFDGLSHQEIADVTGIPLGTIKSRIRTGLAKLRGLLAQHLDEAKA